MPARLVAALAAILALAPASVAAADVYTVQPGAGDCSDRSCGSVADAVAAARAGDTIKISKGTYAESISIAAGKDNLRIEGASAADVKLTGSGAADVVAIAANGVRLSGLTVEVPSGGASAVDVSGAGAIIGPVVLQRAAGAGDEPAVNVPGAATLDGAFVVQGAGAAPAVRSGGAGTSITDSVILNATGPAAVFSSAEANKIVRSTLASTEASSDAVQLLSANAGKRALTTDSSIFVGGASAAGIVARSTGSAAGDIALQVRHATIAGSAKGIVVDASAANGTAGVPLISTGTPSGNIDADVFASIVQGASEAQKYTPGPLDLGRVANTASLTFANSNATAATGSGTIDMGGATAHDAAILFAPKSLKLRADAPVIDKGGPLQSGESTTDIDGGARETDGPDADAAAQSDIGADEYVNQAPASAFGITNKNPRQNEVIGFISGSIDPEQGVGGAITEYRWDFGDGQTQTTTVGAATHAYPNVGTYNVSLTVVDNQGEVSKPSVQQVVVKDGVAPALAITAPADKARVNLRSTYVIGKKKPKPRQLTILGTVADASGVESVEVALYVTKRDKVKRAKKKKTAKRAQKRCEFYSGRLFARKACDKEIWLKAKLVPGGFSLKTRKGLRLPAGTYQVKVRAKDTTGLLTSGFTKAAKTLVNFRVK